MANESSTDGTQTSRLLCEAFLDLYPGEAAAALESASVEEIAGFLAGQAADSAARLLERLDPILAGQCLTAVGRDMASGILSRMSVPHATLVLARLDASSREGVLDALDQGFARELQESLSYPPDTAGQLMDTQLLALGPALSAEQALARVRTLGRARTQHVWVVDEDSKLMGRIGLAEIVLADPGETLGGLLAAPVTRVPAMAPREEVVDVLTRTRAGVIAVVDLDERLLGIIRYDALVQAVEEEVSADIQTMVGVGKEERALSRPLFAVGKRLPWLNINLLTAFLAASVVGLFEQTIAQFTALAVLLPVVAGQSGNTGAQALAVTMRGLALREIRPRHARGVIFKETLVGGINGVAIALVTAAGVYVWSRSPGLSLVIALAMVLSMVMAGLAGAAIPLILSALRQDPAQSGSIILTTVTDVAGFFSFLGLATLFSSML